MFKHNSKSFFWIGNGSFLASEPNTSSGVFIGDVGGYNLYPFAIDASYSPIPRRFGFDNVSFERGWTYESEVYNSALFANLMAWALYQSEFYGIN